VTLHDVFEDVPYHRILAVNYLFGGFDGFNDSTLDQFANDKRLEQFSSHVFGQTTLVHLQLRTNDNNGTGRIIHALTEQVLTETTLFPFERVGQGFQWPVGVGFDSA